MKTRQQIIFVVVIIAIVTVGLLLLMAIHNANETLTGTSYNAPTKEQITQMCYDKLKDTLGTEPTKLSINICVGTIIDGLNK